MSFAANDQSFHDRANKAKKAVKLVAAEIESVKKCTQCHINANAKETRKHWFTMVCDVPHYIIWAYKKNARYWPAKVMSISGQEVDVSFFGGYHKQEIVPAKKCFLYSTKRPGNIQNAKSQDIEYKKALAVIGFEYGFIIFAYKRSTRLHFFVLITGSGIVHK